jgi:hypothetical protein
MKGKLIKTDVNYLLEDNKGVVIGSTSTKEINKLSTKNCDEIFGVVDVDGLARKWRDNSMYRDANAYSYKAGFNKAMELNKDKVFTLEDIKKALTYGWRKAGLGLTILLTEENGFIQSLQQPTEIEVEVITEEFESYNENLDIIKKPILDSEGCLILKKI